MRSYILLSSFVLMSIGMLGQNAAQQKTVYQESDKLLKSEFGKNNFDKKKVIELSEAAIKGRDVYIDSLEAIIEQYRKQAQIPVFFAITDSTIYENKMLEENDLVSLLVGKDKADYDKIVAIREFTHLIDSVQSKVAGSLKEYEQKGFSESTIYELIRSEVKADLYQAKDALRTIKSMLKDEQTGEIKTNEYGFITKAQLVYFQKYEGQYSALYKRWILNEKAK